MAAVVLAAGVVFLLLTRGPSYDVTAKFANASQLVPGNDVAIAGTSAASRTSRWARTGRHWSRCRSRTSTRHCTRGRSRRSARSRCRGIANRYVQLQLPPADQEGPPIHDGATLPLSATVSEVDLDQLFNTLDTKTVGHFKDVVKGFARSYDGIGPQTNRTFTPEPVPLDLAPGVRRATRDENRFRHLSSTPPRSRARSPSEAPTSSSLSPTPTRPSRRSPRRTRTWRGRSASCRASCATSTPPRSTCGRPSTTSTRWSMRPSRWRRSCRRSPRRWRGSATDAVPTVRRLDAVVRRPGADNDLTEADRVQPRLARIAVGARTAKRQDPTGALPCLLQGALAAAFRLALLPALPDRRSALGLVQRLRPQLRRLRRQRRHRPDRHHLQLGSHRRRRVGVASQ